MGKHRSARPVGFWTRENVALLRRFWKTDAPSSEIAAQLGCTKNAACGKAHRLGLPPKPPFNTSTSRRAERLRSRIGFRAALTRRANAR